MRHILLLMIAIVPLAAFQAVAQTSEELDDAFFFDEETTFEESDGFSVIDDGFDPLAENDDATLSGPGFRQISRARGGGNREHVESEIDVNLLNGVNPSLNFLQGNEERELSFYSLQVLKQHFWDGEGRLINSRSRSWRSVVGLESIEVETGWLPVADVALPSQRPAREGERWLSGLRSARYLGYGVRAEFQKDDYRFNLTEQVVGDVNFRTDSHRFAFGPAIEIGTVYSNKRWRFEHALLLMSGYGETRFVQNDRVGSLPLNIVETRFVDTEHDFAYFFQARVGLTFFLTDHWSIDVAARADGFGPWRHSYEAAGSLVSGVGLGDFNADDLIDRGVVALGISCYQ